MEDLGQLSAAERAVIVGLRSASGQGNGGNSPVGEKGVNYGDGTAAGDSRGAEEASDGAREGALRYADEPVRDSFGYRDEFSGLRDRFYFEVSDPEDDQFSGGGRARRFNRFDGKGLR